MKIMITLFLALMPFSAMAGVDFVHNGQWLVGQAHDVILTSAGLVAADGKSPYVVLNFEHGKQLKLTDSDTAIGLALVPLQNQCVRVIPGLKWASVSIISNCN